MPGWRIGWGVMPAELAVRVKLFLDNFIGCPNSIGERAALEALNGPGIEAYQSQRRIIYNWLKRKRIPCNWFQSGFYAFANFGLYARPAGGSMKLAERILKSGVVVTPGIAFGDHDDYLRISYCVSAKNLKKALKKIENTLY
jgi:aspartate/methionine/tyrosine aminotransferase